MITLELLGRGHLQALGGMNEQLLLTYQRVFGDPLHRVQIRLGHRSVTAMAIYLHTLVELVPEAV